MKLYMCFENKPVFKFSNSNSKKSNGTSGMPVTLCTLVCPEIDGIYSLVR